MDYGEEVWIIGRRGRSRGEGVVYGFMLVSLRLCLCLF